MLNRGGGTEICNSDLADMVNKATENQAEIIFSQRRKWHGAESGAQRAEREAQGAEGMAHPGEMRCAVTSSISRGKEGRGHPG